MIKAMMVPNLISPFFSKLVNCINQELTARKYRMLFYATDYDPAQEQELVHLAEQQKVDGIICLSYNPYLQVSPDVPMVSIDRYFGAQIPCVSSDNYGGGRLAAEKLVETAGEYEKVRLDTENARAKHDALKEKMDTAEKNLSATKKIRLIRQL